MKVFAIFIGIIVILLITFAVYITFSSTQSSTSNINPILPSSSVTKTTTPTTSTTPPTTSTTTPTGIIPLPGLKDTPLLLRTTTDTNHGLIWSSDVDGPALFGYAGGKLMYGGKAGKKALWWDNNGNIAVAGDVSIAGKLRTAGHIGPYQMRFYNKNNACLDVGQWGGSYLNTCAGTNSNDWQRFFYNPVTGHLFNVTKNQCLDASGNVWGWANCSNDPAQRFTKNQHLLQWRDGNCLDTGNNTSHSGCGATNNNQMFVFDYVG